MQSPGNFPGPPPPPARQDPPQAPPIHPPHMHPTLHPPPINPPRPAPMLAPPPEGRPIFVGNFEYETRAADLERLFAQYGPVARIDLKRGFAFLFMRSEAAGQAAISGLNGIPFGDTRRRTLKVEWARGDGAIKRREDERRRRGAPPSETLFVVNFNPALTGRPQLEAMFLPFGRVVRLELQQRFAFVEYADMRDATAAMRSLNGKMLADRELIVEYTVRGGHAGGRKRYRERGGMGYDPHAMRYAPHARPDPYRYGRARSPSPRSMYGRGRTDRWGGYGRDRSRSPRGHDRDVPLYRSVAREDERAEWGRSSRERGRGGRDWSTERDRIRDEEDEKLGVLGTRRRSSARGRRSVDSSASRSPPRRRSAARSRSRSRSRSGSWSRDRDLQRSGGSSSGARRSRRGRSRSSERSPVRKRTRRGSRSVSPPTESGRSHLRQSARSTSCDRGAQQDTDPDGKSDKERGLGRDGSVDRDEKGRDSTSSSPSRREKRDESHSLSEPVDERGSHTQDHQGDDSRSPSHGQRGSDGIAMKRYTDPADTSIQDPNVCSPSKKEVGNEDVEMGRQNDDRERVSSGETPAEVALERPMVA